MPACALKAREPVRKCRMCIYGKRHAPPSPYLNMSTCMQICKTHSRPACLPTALRPTCSKEDREEGIACRCSRGISKISSSALLSLSLSRVHICICYQPRMCVNNNQLRQTTRHRCNNTVPSRLVRIRIRVTFMINISSKIYI
jgi:hypothetical protein